MSCNTNVSFDHVKFSVIDILYFMRSQNCYSRALEEQLLEFLFNLSKISSHVE